MSDPQPSKYGQHFDPNAQGSDQPNPDGSKDFSYLVPQVEVAWSTPPSFNTPPPDVNQKGGGSGGAGTEAPPCGPIQVNLATLRQAEESMLGSARTAVGNYQALRDKVMAVKDTVFGQQASLTESVVTPSGEGPASYAGETTGPSPIQESGRKFAENINPAQEKALWQMANALEVVGQYIAAVNRSGQSYALADRKAEFPPPPPNPVTR